MPGDAEASGEARRQCQGEDQQFKGNLPEALLDDKASTNKTRKGMHWRDKGCKPEALPASQGPRAPR